MLAPHIKDEPAPLREIVHRALRRFGDFSPASVQGDAASMFLEFANIVLDDWNFHPYYREYEYEVAPYVSVDEARPIPDVVMLHGLLMHYSVQQMSEKAPVYQAMYYQTLNREAYRTLTDGNNPKLLFRPVDSSQPEEPEASGVNLDMNGFRPR